MRTDEQRAAHAAYERRRHAAIKAGTWNPRRAAEPTLTPQLVDVAWAAGYLEGEGSFRCDGSLGVRADSTDREPIVRLRALFGGGLSDGVTRTSSGKPVYRWSVHGEKAERLMLAIWPLMSPRRRGQIDAALERRRPVGTQSP